MHKCSIRFHLWAKSLRGSFHQALVKHLLQLNACHAIAAGVIKARATWSSIDLEVATWAIEVSSARAHFPRTHAPSLSCHKSHRFYISVGCLLALKQESGICSAEAFCLTHGVAPPRRRGIIGAAPQQGFHVVRRPHLPVDRAVLAFCQFVGGRRRLLYIVERISLSNEGEYGIQLRLYNIAPSFPDVHHQCRVGRADRFQSFDIRGDEGPLLADAVLRRSNRIRQVTNRSFCSADFKRYPLQLFAHGREVFLCIISVFFGLLRRFVFCALLYGASFRPVNTSRHNCFSYLSSFLPTLERIGGGRRATCAFNQQNPRVVAECSPPWSPVAAGRPPTSAGSAVRN